MKKEFIPQIQEKFINELIKRTNSKKKLAELLVTELNICKSASYNRINNKKPLTLNEVEKLAKLCGISIDQFFLPDYSRITFVSDAMRRLPRSYDQYLTNVVNVLLQLKRLEGLTATTIGTEIPLFHYASFPNLYHFKLFYWKQTFWEFGNDNELFSLHSQEIDDVIKDKTKIIGRKYNSINSTEIWTTDLFTPILKQIIYFLELGCFDDDNEAMTLINDVKKLSARLKEFCSNGHKSYIDSESSIEVYYNELHDGTDALLFNSDFQTLSFIKYDGPNFIKTNQNEFGVYSNKWISNIISKSTSISANNQRQRRIFFNHVNAKIEAAEERVMQLIGSKGVRLVV